MHNITYPLTQCFKDLQGPHMSAFKSPILNKRGLYIKKTHTHTLRDTDILLPGRTCKLRNYTAQIGPQMYWHTQSQPHTQHFCSQW